MGVRGRERETKGEEVKGMARGRERQIEREE